ncbi:MAG: hypothetical protein QXO86_06105 [Nitrososphaerota archaeon]
MSNFRKDTLLALAIGIAYMAVFSYLSGATQYFLLPNIRVEGFKAVYVYFESQNYNGPGIQLFWNESMVMVRLYVVFLGALISALVVLNVDMLLKLVRRGMVRACLLRSTGTGLAMLLSSIATATYACCGWAPTVAILGISLSSILGLAPAIASAALLSANAFILHKRLTSPVMASPR